MDFMFVGSPFDQDISRWCVAKIPSKPTYFDETTVISWTAAEKPLWGHCPDPNAVTCAAAPDITVGNFILQACNVGATFAGTGTLSYGKYYQRGNTSGWTSSETPVTLTTQINAAGF
jgi:hypothetical protein